MDKALYIGVHGASDTMHQLEVLTNNLANVNTTGFRSDNVTVKAHPVKQGQESRVFSKLDQGYSVFDQGPVLSTGRDLDVSIAKEGFIAVQSKSGQEGYTRAGDLEITDKGLLTTRNGSPVLGDRGLITIPPASKISISPDGTVSAILNGESTLVTIDRMKLTKPPLDQISKGEDGYFYLPEGGTVTRDENVKLVTRTLEGSNVNPVTALTDLIELSRSFELHTNLMKVFQDDASVANQLLQLPR